MTPPVNAATDRSARAMRLIGQVLRVVLVVVAGPHEHEVQFRCRRTEPPGGVEDLAVALLVHEATDHPAYDRIVGNPPLATQLGALRATLVKRVAV